ncbi:DUF1810 domain-containing protein [Acuticoccus sp. MNP-M23]|uniref:DUF1810 domain-containing protein n=1 Tax=Acuticoccus sp. MNP-M23 TaxID=3072793 RepID=UPI00281597D4|nr:DUF1810 domain-containing protein [Acuticoccus sp. MNP-M23]WMS44899.1 DUF1810 domain-containing protein [Acuticoccus sp. MNP-M23]
MCPLMDDALPRDPYDLARFLKAQDGVFDAACRELRDGLKRSHFMWFVFPQLAGLGRSSTAQFYAIGSLAEARAYAAHPVLGPRLATATRAVLDADERDPLRLFGAPDHLKFRSSMTLFGIADPARPIYAEALNELFDAKPDMRTVESPIIKAHI